MTVPLAGKEIPIPVLTGPPDPKVNGTVSPPPIPSTKDDGSKTELVKVNPADVGMSVGFKHLYSGKEDKRGRFQWQPTIPEDVGKPAEDAESEKWAIIVRHVKVFNDAKRVLGVHSIVVQSPLLKDLLKDVLQGYPGVTVNLKRLEFSGLFEPLIHRWEALNEAIAKLAATKPEEGAEVDAKLSQRIEHANLLRELLTTEFKDTIEASTDLRNQGVITYEHLWTIFHPGHFVYSKQQGQDRVFRLHSSRYGLDRDGNEVMWLTCSYVDYDGTRFGTNKLNLSISEFEGTKSITALNALPFEFHTHKDDLRTKLVERGEKIEQLAGSHYRWYNGVGWRFGNMGNKEKYTVKGRIVIDTYGWNRFNPNMSVFVTPFHVKESPLDQIFLGIPPPPVFVEGDDDEYDDSGSDVGIPMDGNFADEDSEDQVRAKLTDDQKLLCSPLVRGYALKEKTWLNFFVNSVQDITFSDRAFECLVLPEKQKELILGFTETQQTHRSYFDDVIESKGRGIIVLLCGPPGVGKTLTAESVAEEMKVPLFMMSAGDLGLDPRSVESKLRGILDMCTRWNAILLLDEADVFLEQRSLHELERNKLVSIFLRVLEYFEGIMFLTTNRVTTFDAAFQSRIHISLEYAELDFKSRKTVWQNFLRQHDIAQATARERPLKALVSAAKVHTTSSTSSSEAVSKEETEATLAKLHHARTHPHAMTSTEIDKLSRLALNGRQIKNILKTAQLLASRRGQGLSYDHIQTVMEVTQHLHNTTRESERVKATFFS